MPYAATGIDPPGTIKPPAKTARKLAARHIFECARHIPRLM
jgi:hypothetical protein